VEATVGSSIIFLQAVPARINTEKRINSFFIINNFILVFQKIY
jgi:hypothetical protein